MIQRLKRILGTEFVRNVLTLMKGTVIGQIAVLLFSPIITRLFSPEDFTTLEQYTMLLAVFGAVITGKYELAIMQPRNYEDARHVAGLANRVALYGCIVLLAIAILFGSQIGDYYKNPDLGMWLWTFPFTLYFFALFNIINYWFSRQKNYKVSATSKVWYSVASEPTKLISGFIAPGSWGLILSTVLGNALTAWYCFRKFVQDEVKGFGQLSGVRVRKLALEYKDYPLYSIWGSILNRSAQWVHVGLFTMFYGLTAVGYMALCRRVVMAPLNIVSGSYSQVFYQRISEFDSPAKLEIFYRGNLTRFLVFSLLFVIIIQVLPSETMGFVFGKEWSRAIDYLKILSYWYALNFATSSLSFITYRIGMQKISLLLDALHFAFVFAAIYYAQYNKFDEYRAAQALVFSKVIYFVINILVVLSVLRRYVRNSTAK